MAHTEAALRLAIRTLLNGDHIGFRVNGVVRSILMPCPDPEPQFACYIAAEVQDSRTQNISRICAIVPIRMPNGIESLQADPALFETTGPLFNECPPYILEALSEPKNEISRRWRARSAAQRWRYEIAQHVSQDGTTDLYLILGARGTEAVIEHRSGLPQEAVEAAFDVFAHEHPMASIALVRPTSGQKRLAS